MDKLGTGTGVRGRKGGKEGDIRGGQVQEGTYTQILSLSFSSSHHSPCVLIPFFSSFFSFLSLPGSRVTHLIDKPPNVRRLHLGSARDHTVYEAEVCRALLSLDFIRATPRATQVSLFLNFQAAITAIHIPKAQPGQHSLRTFWTGLRRIQQQRTTLSITIHWVPGYEDMAANEQVDLEAKIAAQFPESSHTGHLI